MIKETLEEAVERKFNSFQQENAIVPKKDIQPFKLGFINGVKWQQEQSENMYSEKDVFTMLLIKHDGLTPEYVLQQFKKQ